MEIQNIGIDLGRGYVKAYSQFNGAKSCMFKSVVGQGRNLDFSQYENPIYIKVDGGEDYFCGLLAEKEGYSPTPNNKDDKTSLTAKKLLYAALNEVAVSSRVKIMLGVPYKMFRKSTLSQVEETYKGKTITIEDKIKGSQKTITIEDISIYRESEAALLYTIATHKDKLELEDKVTAMVTVGFRTTELSYFDKGMKFIDKKSDTLEKGNRTVLEYVRSQIIGDSIVKELYEIDSSNDYNKLKDIGYANLIESIDQDVENMWINYSEMKIFMAGGTALKLNKIPEKFEMVEDPQMITAKGLNFVAEKRFK